MEGTSKKVALHNSSGQRVFDGGKVEVTCTGQELKLVCGNASILLKRDGENGRAHQDQLSEGLTRPSRQAP
ncbi:hypothetical protein D7Y15_29750 [Corallococcus sp. AB030]|nr:hypothetical protein D7Y15_29750 [Corallococcus sp. AB030]